jgi:hypothetical protein
MSQTIAYKFWFFLGRSCRVIEDFLEWIWGAALILVILAIFGGLVVYLGAMLISFAVAFPLLAILIVLILK